MYPGTCRNLQLVRWFGFSCCLKKPTLTIHQVVSVDSTSPLFSRQHDYMSLQEGSSILLTNFLLLNKKIILSKYLGIIKMNFPCFEIFIFVLKDMKTTSLLVQSVLQEYQVFPRRSGYLPERRGHRHRVTQWVKKYTTHIEFIHTYICSFLWLIFQKLKLDR